MATAYDWENGEGYRRAPLAVPASGQPGFTLMDPAMTGITFTNRLSQERAMANANLLNGSGVALGDFDGDGLCDIYFCSLEGSNRLYRNLGNWQFEDVTEKAGVGLPDQLSTGAVFADVNGNGRLDLLVTSMGGPNALFINEGGGRFRNATESAGLSSRWGASSMALADVNGNGALDLYVANYGVQSILRSGGGLNITFRDGRWVVQGRYARRIKVLDGRMFELGEPDTLYLNDGRGNFRAVPWNKGTFLDERGKPIPEAPWDQSLSVLMRDLTGNGFPDIYTCGDGSTPDRFWINDGQGRFTSISSEALPQISFSSMGVDAADVDRDGHDDLFIVDMLSRGHEGQLTQRSALSEMPLTPVEFDARRQMMRNTLFRARGDGTFEELAYYSGTAASDWSWGCIFIDVDLDGWEDILVSTGFPYGVDDLDTREEIQRMGQLTVAQSRQTFLMFPPLLTPNLAFRNLGGMKFEEVGETWGFASTNVSQGMALADLNNDGALDVVINCLNAPALVYRNNASAPRVAVRLKGLAPNTQGIGAKISLFGGAVPVQTQEVISGGRYVSGDDPMRVFAAGTLDNGMRIEVDWRSGGRSVVEGVKANHLYVISEEGKIETDGTDGTDMTDAIFEDVSHLLGHRHEESPFDDFALQPLLPKKLSELGPGVAWFDLDGNGREELILGSGRGGRIAIYRSDEEGNFFPFLDGALEKKLPEDATGVVGWVAGEGERAILAGNANYEARGNNHGSVWRWDFVDGQLKEGESLPDMGMSSGPLAVADVNGSGELDVFVGGRFVPGRFPEPASSFLFQNQGGRLLPDEKNNRVLEKVGLVSGAVWSDLDGDGWPDLVLACEWGPVRVFLNEQGALKEVTEEWGFAEHTGLWTSVATGDFNGNGRLDIVAGNWGENSFYQEPSEGPWHLFYGDFRGDGEVGILEAYYNPEMDQVAPRRYLHEVAVALPWVRDVFPTHRAYAQAGIEQVLGGHLSKASELRVTTLRSTIFFNRGDHFEAVPLPKEAQWSPVMGLNVGDMDGDGNEDLFLSQNFFAVRPADYRMDAGRGLWLRGDGEGGFAAVPGQESGIKVYGQQRGAVLGDFDGDGRVDLVVSQNGAATRLFRNRGAKPGLRVRLIGPPGNPNAIGASMRLKSGERHGPSREVQAGSGYWSQNSAVQVLGSRTAPRVLWVRWPGGKETEVNLPPGAREVAVTPSGTVQVAR